jgi:hypothetical protein
MNILLMLLCCVVAVSPLRAEEKNVRNGAHIKFESTECDFGEVSRKDDNRSCVFSFVNDGTEPLVLLSATTSCSCLKAEFPRKPIAVGGKGEVRLVLESKKVDKGIFRRVVQIHSTSTGGTEILTIKGVSKD